MLSFRTVLPQYKNSPPKAQTTAFKNSLLKIGGVDARSLVEIKRRRIGYTLSIYFGVATTQIPAYFQKVVDTHNFVGIITQQLSNSATQQLRRKVCLRPERRATFTFRQQHHYFSSIFADGKSGVLFFHVRQSLRFVLSGLSCALGMQRSRSCKVIINKAFYRQAWQAVWFDSG